MKIYEKFPKITEIFPINSVGITTARDHFVIDHDKNRLLNRIRLFRNSKYSDDELLSFFRLNKSKGWNIRKAWNALQSISDSELKEFLQPVLYRPFDIQWIFYHDSLIERPRREVMRHMLKENLGLVITRQTGQSGLGPVFVSDTIIEARSIIFASSVSYLMPLYLYQEKNNPKRRSLSNIMMLFETDSNYGDKKPNLSSALTSNLAKEYKNTPSPEEIFFYIYAVLYSNIYREKYEEFLKIDFPRVPFTKNYKQFKKMGEYGEKLMNLHLLESPDLDPPSARFQGKGNNKVEKLRYEKGGLYINDDQYFEGISLDVWEYKIGGYQVCDKWLKERKGRILTVEEIKKCCEIVTALKKTIETQEKIDKIYPEIEKEIIDKP
ncbi:MAG: helicase [Deltaproteobacteria bacterium]|nr:helicase [Deltaproteobacteria bacterium]